MENKTYLIFVMFVYEHADEAGRFQNSTEVQLVDINKDSAKKRALQIAGNKKRKFVHTKTIIERLIENK